MHLAGFLLLVPWITLAAAQSDPLYVELPNGKVLGRDRGGYYSFESIPYAMPPVGKLRFESPQPYTRKWETTFNATTPPVFCMQWSQLVGGDNKLLGVEDCLTISVYKPKPSSAHEVFPVVIEIHGGAFMFTVSGRRSHEGFMTNGNVILVKFSYRLGPLGFLNTGDKVLPGNYGLKDQRLALRWIKRNIDCFGGDPKNMIVVGLAAGGASVHLQMMHKEFEEVAKGAISISGNALLPWVVQQGGRRRAIELGYIVGCGIASSSEELKKCLQAREATQKVGAMRRMMLFGYVPFTPFGPMVEPVDAEEPFLTKHPTEILKSGKFAQVPWTVSYTSENGIYNAAQLLKRQCDGSEMMDELNSRWFELAPHLFFYRDTMKTIEDMDNYSRNLRQHYMGNKNFSSAHYEDVQRMFTEILFKNGTEQAIDLHNTHGTSTVYGFVYDNPADYSMGQWISQRDDFQFGTGITDDYFLLFEHPLRKTLRKDEKIISNKMVRMLEDFVQSENATLSYDSCDFPLKPGKKGFEMLSISRHCCNVG